MEHAFGKTNILLIQNVERLPVGFLELERNHELQLHKVHYRDLAGVQWSDGQYAGVIVSGTDYAPHLHPELFDDQRRLLRECPLPVLAICGGFQLVCLAWGASITDIEVPFYGRTQVRVERKDVLWDGLSESFCVFSKHRYAVRRSVPSFEVTARSELGDFVYGIRHRSRPIWGVQFHPERRQDGTIILSNFVRLTQQKGIYAHGTKPLLGIDPFGLAAE